ELPADRLYAALRRGGLDHGPSLRVVSELWRGQHECVARLDPTGSGPATVTALLDGALQCVAAIDESPVGSVPVGVDEVVLVAWPSSGTTWVHVAEREAGPDGRRYDLVLSTSDGRPLVALTGLRLARFD